METFNSILRVLARILIVFDVLLVTGFVIAFARALKYRPKVKPAREPREVTTLRRTEIREKWRAIEKCGAGGGVENMKQALVEADALVDGIMANAGLEGTHMADRLEKIPPGELKSAQRLWRAHRITREAMDVTDFELTRPLAQKALADYEAFLNEIRAL